MVEGSSSEAEVEAQPPLVSEPEVLSIAMTETVELDAARTRREHDLLGEANIPAQALWGIHTKRAVENFPITGVPVGHFPDLVRALALVKQAAARANRRLGFLTAHKAEAIERACVAVAAGKHSGAFVVDAVQGGAGTSTNMNANEVIANLGLAHMGQPLGQYGALHPTTMSTWRSPPTTPIRPPCASP